MADSVSSDTEAHRSCAPSSRRGGWITFPFIAATIFGLSLTSFGWLLNLIAYLTEEFNIKSISAAQISNIVNGCVNMFPLVAAIIADSFFGNITITSFTTFISLIGIVFLTLMSSLDNLRPKPCETGSLLCQSPSKLQLGFLYASLALVSIGSGASRLTLGAAGANQHEKPKDQASFFNWFLFTAYVGALIAATGVVYTQDNVSWTLGFGICAAANLICFIVFISGKRFYKPENITGSPFTAMIRVLVAATKKRKAVISSRVEDYHQEDKTSAPLPSQSFKFLNRAALKTKEEGSNYNMWRLCSVEEVEDLKDVVRLLPLWADAILVSIPVAMQMSLTVLQAMAMDRWIGSHFKFPAGSLQLIPNLSTCAFIILNNLVVIPMYQKLIRKRLTLLQQVGIGHVFSILSMAIFAIVEAKRLKTVENSSHPNPNPMSVLWLFSGLVLIGIGEAFHFPATVAIFYGEFPESLKNTATSLTSLLIGISFYLSTALTNIVQKTTAWLPDDINHGRVDNVYWLLVTGGLFNFVYFLVCSSIYRYKNIQDDHDPDPIHLTT